MFISDSLTCTPLLFFLLAPSHSKPPFLGIQRQCRLAGNLATCRFTLHLAEDIHNSVSGSAIYFSKGIVLQKPQMYVDLLHLQTHVCMSCMLCLLHCLICSKHTKLGKLCTEPLTVPCAHRHSLVNLTIDYMKAFSRLQLVRSPICRQEKPLRVEMRQERMRANTLHGTCWC